jgi:hypothetical protein
MAEQLGKGLLAGDQLVVAQIVALQLDQIERHQRCTSRPMAPASQGFKVGYPVRPADYDLAVDQEGCRPPGAWRLNDERKPTAQS